ncbi:hypothetical protein FSP39_020648 [Pinctada imbricata]|uniref:Uncharacterized protein n=1 Tax=Pinctada imbricata TaxID=66713 RepID=A0AA89C965_PINIB|nr:hypothetical protein FSP39_020648 [Pinctada imbricata]
MPLNSSRRISQIEKSAPLPEKSADNGNSNGKADDLTEIKSDLAEIKKSIKRTEKALEKSVKSEDLRELVASIIKEILAKNKEELTEIIDEKVDERCREVEHKFANVKMDLRDDIDSLNMDIETFREKLAENNRVIRDLQKKLERAENNATDALRKSNRNEQYSRKTNIKVCGVKEEYRENTVEVVRKVLKEKAGVDIQEKDVVAVHRIPGKPNLPKPILLKVKNSEIKTSIMRKRSDVKKAQGNVKLVDDVTELNAKLIDKLFQHDDIESAYYYNGAVYGISNGKRFLFDIDENIDMKLKIRKR